MAESIEGILTANKTHGSRDKVRLHGTDVTEPKRWKCFWTFCTAKWALAFLSIAVMLQQMTLNGLLSVVISTLEKRFELRSTESGIIASFFGIASFVSMIFISLADESVHKTKWFSRGSLINGIAGLLFALPHFLAPVYTFTESESRNFCGNVTLQECGTSSIRNYRFIFIGAVSIMGVGSSFQHSYGITYLNENVSKDDSTLYNAIYLAVSGLGPAIGFVGGGAALELYTYPSANTHNLSIDSSNELWIGAWWLGFLVSGVLMIISAIPIRLLPRHLPGTERFRQNRDIEMQKLSDKANKSVTPRSPSRKLADILALLRNMPFMLITLGSAVNLAFIFGFNTFGAKYLESVFGLTPFHASLVYGVTAIVASFTGQVVSGYLVRRFSLTMKGIIKLTVVCGIFSAVCSLGFLVHCEDADVAGATVPYPNTTLIQSPHSICNADCGCTTDKYEPVCNDRFIYYSPCFAGCTEKISDAVYGSCSCVANFSQNSSQMALVSTESCQRSTCSMIYPFLIIIFFCFFSSIMTIPPGFQITLRCVPFEKRILALSIQRMVGLSIGIVPGRILTGVVMDLACVSWSTECGEQGSCKAYRRWDLARNNMILLLAQTTICAILYILVYVTYDPVVADEGKIDATSSQREGRGSVSLTQPDHQTHSLDLVLQDEAISSSQTLLPGNELVV